MKAGKLPQDLLERLLQRLPDAPGLLLGPGTGRDAAAIDLGGGRVLVAKADPITFATDSIGRYAVHVNANDVACLGARPRWFLATVFLPEGADPSLAERIFDDVLSACMELGVTPAGGHTEITIGLGRPIVSGAMLGETTADRLVRPEAAREGDHLILTKAIAIEGTAVLAREAPDELRRRGVPHATIERSARLLDAPGISVVREAVAACETGAVHALHDPTEGGLATALRELSIAAGRLLRVRTDDIPVLPETADVCRALDLDPLGLLASGALLAAVEASACDHVRKAVEREGIPATCIGDVAGLGEAAIMDSRKQEPLPAFQRDELARCMDTLGGSTPTGPGHDT